MTSLRRALPGAPLPRLPAALLRRLLPPAERGELLDDIAAEYGTRVAAHGVASARGWLWRQTLGSAPALLGWTWWRGWTEFEPRANRMRPGGPMLKSWWNDLRYAARRLRNRPLYALLATLTLALGVGGTAAVYGIARRLLFDPLPYAHESEVTTFWMPYSWSEEEFLFLRGHIPGYRSVAAYMPNDVTLREGDAPARLVPGMRTTAELFDVLGAQPVVGRTFKPGDDLRGAEPVSVISYGLWQELGGDPGIVGKRLTLDGAPRTVIGVMPRDFWFPSPATRIWNAADLNPENRSGNYTFVGRVAPGHDVHAMDAPVAQLTKIIGPRFKYPEKWDKTKDAKVTPIRDDLMGSMRPALLATLGAMGLILLIACANVAALMLGQVDARGAELAVRSALGANQRRLTQQLVAEALLIAVLAAAAGSAIAASGFHLLAQALPLGAWADSATPDWRVFAIAIAIAIGASLLVVLVPTMSLWRGPLRGELGRARTGGLEGRGGRLENGLVVAEVALAVLITAGAALLVRSVENLYAVDAGLAADHVAVVDVVSGGDIDRDRQWPLVQQMLEQMRALPGVRSAAATTRLPLRGGGDNWGVRIEGQDATANQTTTYMRIASADYFATMGMKLRAGRLWNAADRVAVDTTAERAEIVNEAFQKKYFGGQSALGRRIGGGFRGWGRIVGIVGNVAEGKLTDDAEPARYILSDQIPYMHGSVAIVLRTAPSTDPATVLDAVRRTVSQVAPGFAVKGTTTMQRVLDTAVGPARQVMSLLALLTALALVLGAVGIYGVIAHFAARRQRDWAIRVALGLRGSRVVSHIVSHGLVLVGIGVAIGLVGVVTLSRLLASLLFGVGVIDPISLVTAGVVLAIVGVLAALVPAWRAGMTDPALALRNQ